MQHHVIIMTYSDMKNFNQENFRSNLFLCKFQIDLKIEVRKTDPNMNKYRYTCAHLQQLYVFIAC